MQTAASRAVMLIEDDGDFRQALVERMTLEGYEVRAFAAAEPALKALTVDFDGAVVTDLRMPGLDGRQLLARVQALDPALPVIMITGHGDIADAVAAMQSGAYDFVAKPFPFERLRDSLNRALEKRSLVLDNRRLTALAAADGGHELPLAGATPAITALRATIAQIADAKMDVLIEGETGVGKEAVARALHNGGRRRVGPFVAVNCGALPANLAESILFGHEKGAFTGAVDKTLGKFREADGGTLFLDEIGELPLDLQVKLLRALQEGEIDPVGGKRPVKIDVRIVSATNRDPAQQVKDGAFREDLFYRLNVFPIEAPSLRDRREDIPALIDHFIARFNAEEGRRIAGCAPETLAMLQAYDWPGNVRELQNVIERSLVMSQGAELHITLSGSASLQTSRQSPNVPPVEGGSMEDAGGELSLEDYFQRFVLQHQDAMNETELAQKLGISRKCLWERRQRFGIPRQKQKSA